MCSHQQVPKQWADAGLLLAAVLLEREQDDVLGWLLLWACAAAFPAVTVSSMCGVDGADEGLNRLS